MSQKITITKKINLSKCNENYTAYQDRWEVDSDGRVGPLFYSIVDDKDFDNEIENISSMGKEVTTEVEDKAGKFVPLSNNMINETKSHFYAKSFQTQIK